MRNKAENFLRPKSNTKNKETFGINSIKNPAAVPEMKNFESELTISSGPYLITNTMTHLTKAY